MKRSRLAQRKKRKYNGGPRSLREKADESSRAGGFALELDPSAAPSHRRVVVQRSGIYGRRSTTPDPSTRQRTFFRFASSTTPQTAASRRSRFSTARTARTRHKHNHKNNSNAIATHVVCAISENLARETCVASLDAGSPTSLQVTKQGNSQTYAETLTYLEILQPDEVLLNEGRQSSQLARKILELYNKDGQQEEGHDDNEDETPEDRFGGLPTQTVVHFLSRSLFDQTKGAQLLKSLAREETYDATVLEEYILLSSSNALLHYVQNSLSCAFSNKSIYLSINTGGNNRMAVDRSTMMQLELLVNSKTGKAKDSLVDTMDCTRTAVGSRLLRTNLMSPPMRAATVNTRLELVELFLGNEEFFYSVLDHLETLPDVNKMLTNVALIPKIAKTAPTAAKERVASKGISALVCIKSTLQALPMLTTVLQSELQSQSERAGFDTATVVTNRSSLLVGMGQNVDEGQLCQQHLLRAILFALTQPGLVTVLSAVADIFSDATEYSRNSNAMRHAECFALKCEDVEIMAIYRKAYVAHVDEIYRKADEYAEVYGISVNVRYTTSRGYFLSVPVEHAAQLPDIFLQPTKSGRTVTFTTQDVSNLAGRAQDRVQDLLLMTHDRIQEVLEVAREHYDALATLCDAVALLDMCHSFADHVTTNSERPWCRPLVSDPVTTTTADTEQSDDSTIAKTSNTLMIRNGFFPISVSGANDQPDTRGPASLIPNDTYATTDRRFTVITGINGSGKSTYLKQIAIIVIMAHCGCFVPAEEATVPMFDRLCCRIGNTDDQEHNISTFMLEMKETAFICNNATKRSLVLVDELGRATSNEDGVAIAWSLAEYLLKQRAMTFFVTHYPQLTCLATIYPYVQNLHLEAAVTRGTGGSISYTHKVKPGSCSVSTDYGVELAGGCGWPKHVVDQARELQDQVAMQLPSDNLCQKRSAEEIPDGKRTAAYNKLLAVMGELRNLVDSKSTHTYASIRSDLVRIRQQHIPSGDEELVEAMDQLLFRTHQVSTDATTGEQPSRHAIMGGTPAESDFTGSSCSSDGSSDDTSSDDESDETAASD